MAPSSTRLRQIPGGHGTRAQPTQGAAQRLRQNVWRLRTPQAAAAAALETPTAGAARGLQDLRGPRLERTAPRRHVHVPGRSDQHRPPQRRAVLHALWHLHRARQL
eukprot:5453825-Prymnesium_polylepis.1